MIVLISSCGEKIEPAKTEYKKGEIPDQESWNTTVTFSDSGLVKAILRAGHISVYNSKGYTLIDSNAVVDFFKKSENVSKLSGKKGKIFDATKDIEVYDSVVFSSKDGSILKTEKLYWHNDSQKVTSDVFVSITTPKEHIEGIGFESDQNLNNYTIYKVTGTFSK